MSDKPDALRLADMLCRHWHPTMKAAAVKLRVQHAEIEEWRAKAAAWIASPEAAQRLEGYRELGRLAEKAETERDALLAKFNASRACVVVTQKENDRLRAERDALRAELREATAATNDPAVNNLRTLPESIRMLRAQRDELLEALQDLCDTLGECGMTEKARAAIAKATGGDNA